ncbi:hypothetical protein [Rhodoferax antarcticus]|uniref:Uncharacterized protein n=1 Tax=Rhodoferax antarcticus ANT.BR TaxID=1111071 RepID=A0A1Q8YEW1_9BURK|nr:hypothetical protein [Rhodoferax antarcticus]APW46303.1 hypothetical protein RA876_07840 [Rhodoferax antarcticus]OLP06515.1 hypothetical protein BLL52_2751 [Rhodoferax antarcticus ANT.BR]
MQAYQFEQYVSPAHRISVELPADAPVGAAKIIVLFPDTERHQPPSQPQHPEFANIAEYLAWHDAQPASGRSTEEIDRQIREEHDGWRD